MLGGEIPLPAFYSPAAFTCRRIYWCFIFSCGCVNGVLSRGKRKKKRKEGEREREREKERESFPGKASSPSVSLTAHSPGGESAAL